MKPKEFDDLIRQKFDENDFEYNPRNWDRLADEMDGRAKKRSVIMWWWMPLAGIAASVALAIGVMPLLRQDGSNKNVAKIESVQKHSFVQPLLYQSEPRLAQAATSTKDNLPYTKTIHKKHKNIVFLNEDKNAEGYVALRIHDAVPQTAGAPVKIINLLAVGNIPSKDKDKKLQVAIKEGINTFKPEETVKKAPKLSLILSGGINRDSQNNGYTAGASIRRMVNDKVFVEGDVAFANSNNTQITAYLAPAPGNSASQGARHSAAKTASPDGEKVYTTVTPEGGVIKDANVSYNLSYAQVTPSIGYKLMKKLSLAVGPDFQQMLVDNRPAPSTVDRGTLQEAAVFDVGFIGKSEYSIGKNVKASVSYRKGVNTLITLTDKYFDRDYLQFQVRCAIFNK